MRREAEGLALLSGLCMLVGPGCQGSSDASSGLTSLIRVEGGQAKGGSISEPATTTPASANIFPRNAMIFAGVSNKYMKGTVGSKANAVALGVAGDVAYWMVPALIPNLTDPDSFDFAVSLSISPEVTQSPLLETDSDGTPILQLSSRAVDNAGNFGPARIQSLYLAPPPATATLAVSLEWDSPTDLDLHVLVPDVNAGYVEVWGKHPSADKGSPEAARSPDGTLDLDSNAGCQIDGRGGENVIWKGLPPAGHYVVQVAAASLCGLTSAAWHAYASAAGVSKGEASGMLTEAAARSGAAAGTGVTVFEFDYP